MENDKKRKILKKHIAGIRDNAKPEEMKSFYKFVGSLMEIIPPGFSVHRRLNPYLRGKPESWEQRERRNRLDEMFKRRELV